ncbi:MAG: DUF2284 domain-containing protein [Thermoanaerobacteraceae bacterium]|nr:DUF2284 domain-containing protein [Thermoanaerobacteraceae bacterium]
MDLLVEIEKAKELKIFAESFEDNTSAKLIHTREIVVDERVRYQCSYSGCREYGKRLMCPPHTPSVDEFKKVLIRYYMALIVQLTGPIKDKDNWEPETNRWALRLHDIVYKLEKKAFALGFPFAAGLIGGSCKLCTKCPVESDNNARCLHREKARPSMEAMGIDVLSTCKKVGLEVAFMPDEVVWTGLVLLA